MRGDRERQQVTSPPTLDVPIQWAIGVCDQGGGGSLEELWDEERYKEESDASSFLAALPSKP